MFLFLSWKERKLANQLPCFSLSMNFSEKQELRSSHCPSATKHQDIARQNSRNQKNIFAVPIVQWWSPHLTVFRFITPDVIHFFTDYSKDRRSPKWPGGSHTLEFHGTFRIFSDRNTPVCWEIRTPTQPVRRQIPQVLLEFLCCLVEGRTPILLGIVLQRDLLSVDFTIQYC